MTDWRRQTSVGFHSSTSYSHDRSTQDTSFSVQLKISPTHNLVILTGYDPGDLLEAQEP